VDERGRLPLFQSPVRVDSSGKNAALVKFDASAATGATSTNSQEFAMTAIARRIDTAPQLPKARLVNPARRQAPLTGTRSVPHR
jgi:hypothetical protein